MNSVQIEQKSYEMPPRDGFTVTHFLTVADIDRSLGSGQRQRHHGDLRHRSRRERRCIVTGRGEADVGGQGGVLPPGPFSTQGGGGRAVPPEALDEFGFALE